MPVTTRFQVFRVVRDVDRQAEPQSNLPKGRLPAGHRQMDGRRLTLRGEDLEALRKQRTSNFASARRAFFVFERVAPNGWDVYFGTFAHGRAEFNIAPLAADGKARGRVWRLVSVAIPRP